jgi:hypothetical protein
VKLKPKIEKLKKKNQNIIVCSTKEATTITIKRATLKKLTTKNSTQVKKRTKARQILKTKNSKQKGVIPKKITDLNQKVVSSGLPSLNLRVTNLSGINLNGKKLMEKK